MLPFARDIQNDICLFLLIYKHMENKILLTDSEMQVGTRTRISTQKKNGATSDFTNSLFLKSCGLQIFSLFFDTSYQVRRDPIGVCSSLSMHLLPYIPHRSALFCIRLFHRLPITFLQFQKYHGTFPEVLEHQVIYIKKKQ